MIDIAPHPLLEVYAFRTDFPVSLDEITVPEAWQPLLSLEATARMQSDDQIRRIIRDLLRHGGFKPTGRSKPAAEYLLRAAGEHTLGPINAAVDACNVVSLHSGLPISVVDLDLTTPPLRVGLATPGESYVFNPSGQSMDISGLLCLFDADGPCANAVKDSQRTKTHGRTRKTLSIVWGSNQLPGRTQQATQWYRELLGNLGAVTAVLHPAGDCQ